MDQNLFMYAEQVQTRMRNINITISNIMQHRKTLNNTSVLIMNRMLDEVRKKLELLENFLTVQNYTQKRVAVIEQYLQEIEVLLNLDL